MIISAIIREAEKKDALKMINYMHKILNEKEICLPLYADEFQASEDKEVEIIDRYKNSTNDVFLIAEYNDEIIGILNSNSNTRKAILHDISFGMSVKKEYRNKGVGYKLLNEFIEWVKSKPDLYVINLTVWKENTKAIDLYKKLGFIVCGERKFSTYKNGQYNPVLTMELEIKKRV